MTRAREMGFKKAAFSMTWFQNSPLYEPHITHLMLDTELTIRCSEEESAFSRNNVCVPQWDCSSVNEFTFLFECSIWSNPKRLHIYYYESTTPNTPRLCRPYQALTTVDFYCEDRFWARENPHPKNKDRTLFSIIQGSCRTSK